jgi:alpha-beta hydrolase superfamily lysophospholipase
LRRVAAAGAVVLALLVPACSRKHDSSPPPSTPLGTYGVGWVAEPAPTSLGEVPTAVFYPALVTPGATAERGADPATDQGPFPLVMFVHGAGTGPQTYQPMIESLAARGYVVAAPAFPESSSPDIVGTSRAQELAEPQALALAQVIERVRTGGSEGVPIASLLTPGQLHLVGHSLGAATVLTAAYNSCCRLPEVTSVSALSPILLETSGEFDIQGAPLLLIHGARDDVIPLDTAQDIYASAAPPKYLVVFEEAGHFEYILPSSPAYVPVVLAVAAQLDGTSDNGTLDPAALERVAETGGEDIHVLADP